MPSMIGSSRLRNEGAVSAVPALRKVPSPVSRLQRIIDLMRQANEAQVGLVATRTSYHVLRSNKLRMLLAVLG